jgi:hypothetical protein
VALVVAVALSPAHPKLFLPAQVLSATEGKLVRWRPDLEFRTAGRVGSVTLGSDGRSLRVAMPPSVVHASGCPFTEYVGDFVGMATATGQLE